MNRNREPYRYQYSHGVYRRNRPTPKRKRRGGLLLILFFIAAIIGGGWFMLKPNGAASNLANSMTQKEEKKPEPPKPKLDRALQTKLTEWANQQDGDFGISVREVTGNMRFANYQADKSFVPASTFKPFVAYMVLHNVEEGQYTLQGRTYKGNSLEYCLERMITVSDNQCAYELERLIGFPEMNTFVQANGFKNTDLNNYDANGRMLATDKASTAADLAELMWRLEKGELLNKEHTEYLIGLMKNQEWRERIPAGVPDGIEVADKPGWLGGIEADMAIVYGKDSTYILTILSADATQSDLADLSTLVYEYLNPTRADTISEED